MPSDVPGGTGAIRYNSILVFNEKIGLVRLRCPFKALVIFSSNDLEINRVVKVKYVQFIPNLPYFKVGKGIYPWFHFAILL